MSASICFEYGGYTFFPLRRFTKEENDFYVISRRIEEDRDMGMTEYKERQKVPYNYHDFYKAATDSNVDIFCCVENGKSYVPGERMLFLYHNPSDYLRREARVFQRRMLLDTKSQKFDMQQIDNRRFMYNPKTGILLLGYQYAPSKKVYGSHAEDLSNARIYSGYDDYVRGWVGTGKNYPYGVIHFAPNVDDRNTDLFNRAFDTLEMFSQNGAEAQTVVRAFGKRWEQPLFGVLSATQEREQKSSVKTKLKQKPEQQSVRQNKSKTKEAEL